MAIAAETFIPTMDYWKRASKVQEGDILFNRWGKPVKVKLVQQYMADCFKVKLDDGLSVTGDKLLKFGVENEKYRDRLRVYKGKQKFRRPLVVMPVMELVERSNVGRRGRKPYSIPTTSPIQTPHQYLPVPPFLLAIWLFGRNANKEYYNRKSEEGFLEDKFRQSGYAVTYQRKTKGKPKTFTVAPTLESQFAPFVPTEIPTNYMMASPEQRLELLSGMAYAGLIHNTKGSDEFTAEFRNPKMATQIQELVESLGIKSRLYHRKQRNVYLFFFICKYKICDWQLGKTFKVHHSRRYIDKTVPAQPRMCVHIETEEPETGFLAGEGFIPCL